MLTLIAVGLLMVALTLAIHASGTTLWVVFLIRKFRNDGLRTARDRWCLFISTAFFFGVVQRAWKMSE